MPASELANKRFFRPAIFGHRHAQPCLSPGCDNVLLLDLLTEGAIWACAKCHGKHEFYTEVAAGPGGYLKYGVVRLLAGEHSRTSGEPGILEFIDE